MAAGSEEMLADGNFDRIALPGTAADEFTQLVGEHVVGYTQKKRLQDALKELNKKVEDVEQKVSVIKAIGKAKDLSNEEKLLNLRYDSFDLKDKIKIIGEKVQGMIDEGQLTSEERPLVLGNLKDRIVAANQSGKAKVVEKLERSIDCVVKIKECVTHPMPNLVELHSLSEELKLITKLQTRPVKTLTVQEREKVDTHDKVYADLMDLGARSRMWFESEAEFHPRLERAIVEHASWVEEQRKLAAERAAEEARLEDERKLERKRQEKLQKEDEDHKALMKKLEEKKAEAALRPVKEVAPKPKKEVKRAVQMDPSKLFVIKDQHVAEEEDPEAAEEHWDEEEEKEEEEQVPSAAAKPAEKKKAPESKPAKAKSAASKFEEAEAKAKVAKDAKPVAAKKAPAPNSLQAITEEELEKKRLAKLEREEQRHKDMEQKLEERRAAAAADAAAKPEKETAAPAPKKNTKARKIDPAELFNFAPTQKESDDEEPEPKTEVAPKNGNGAKPAPSAEVAKPAEEPKKPAAKVEPVAKPKPKPKRVPAEPLVSKWGDASPAEALAVDDEDDAGPSLAASMKEAAPKVSKPAPPKKGGKAKFSKMSAVSLGFDDNNPNLPRQK